MIHNLWSTPIEHGKFEAPDLVSHILTTYDMTNPPSDVNNYNIFDEQSKAIINFKKIVYDNFKKYISESYDVDIDTYQSVIKGWITGHGKNYSMTIHNHSGAAFSAVYYVMAEQANKGGALVLSDPRTNANRGYDDKFQPHFGRFHVQPETNDFVIFPSFVYHHVDPYYSQFRIAIPVDLYIYDMDDDE